MKRVDELLDQIDLKKEDYDFIQEEALLEVEMEELQAMVLSAIRQEQEERGKEKMRCKTKKMKKWLLPLVASITITSTAIAATTDTSIGQIFKSFFGVESTSIGESGKVIGKTNSSQGIALNIQGVVGDNKTAVVMLDLTKEDGTAFLGNNVDFGKLDFKVAGKSVEGSCDIINQQNQSDTQRTCSLTPLLFNDMPKNFLGKEATVKITDIIQIDQGYWKSEINLADYIEQHQECMNQQTIAMPEEFLKYNVGEEELIESGYNKAEISEIMNRNPKQVLEDKNLGLALYDGKQKEWTIDNIGFIDGRLHIRMSGKTEGEYMPDFKDAEGNDIRMIWSGGSIISKGNAIGYYVFDIKDLESLRKTTMTGFFRKELGVIKGQWEVPFAMDIKSNEKTIKTTQTIPWSSGKVLTIEEMTLSNLAVHVTYVGDKFEAIPKGTLIFKDGTEKELLGGASFDKGKAIASYDFKAPIEITNVAAIKLNDVEIKVE
ncbi:MAG: hypothetical protein AB9856_15340 [Cellulosilyticaceae bacterium]